MLAEAREVFWDAIKSSPWVSSLANILPLSALLDFLDTARILHAFELSGTTPLWSWPVTPAGSRIILSKQKSGDVCCLDKPGRTPSLVCLDGRYGDMYNAANPETLRLCIANAKICFITYDKEILRQPWARPQKLTVVRVTEMTAEDLDQRQPARWRRVLATGVSSGLPWLLLLCLLIVSELMYCWLTMAFLLVVPATGAIISLTRGGQPRELRRASQNSGKKHNRLVVAASHMNESEWLAFYGESTIVNALLNHRLRRHDYQQGLLHRNKWPPAATTGALRVLILAQWALAVGAAALQGWDAYLVTFWIFFCIVAHLALFPLERCVKDWARDVARLEFTRFETKFSGRRALLTALMALNPDTFLIKDGEQDWTKLSEEGTLWIDQILRSGTEDRKSWQEATRCALVEAKGERLPPNESTPPRLGAAGLEGGHWATAFKKFMWCDAVPEGINMAQEIIEQAGLTGRVVGNKLSQTV